MESDPLQIRDRQYAQNFHSTFNLFLIGCLRQGPVIFTCPPWAGAYFRVMNFFGAFQRVMNFFGPFYQVNMEYYRAFFRVVKFLRASQWVMKLLTVFLKSAPARCGQVKMIGPLYAQVYQFLEFCINLSSFHIPGN